MFKSNTADWSWAVRLSCMWQRWRIMKHRCVRTCTNVLEVSRTDVVPTSPQDLLSSRFIAGTSVTTNTACSDLLGLIWGHSKPAHTPKWFLIILRVTHEELRWLRHAGSALIKAQSRRMGLHAASLKEQLSLDVDCTFFFFGLFCIIKAQRCLAVSVGSSSTSSQSQAVNQKAVWMCFDWSTVSEQVQSKEVSFSHKTENLLIV